MQYSKRKLDSQNTIAAYQEFITQHPNDTHAQEARDRVKKLEDDQAWANAQKANTSDVPGLEVVAPTGTEKRHIVASGPMTEEDAKAACAKLKKARAHCEVVQR